MGKPVDQPADIWALGIVIAEMCTGRNLFQRETAPATILAISERAAAIAGAAPDPQ
jgi:serine/threonine protein kinase